MHHYFSNASMISFGPWFIEKPVSVTVKQLKGCFMSKTFRCHVPYAVLMQLTV